MSTPEAPAFDHVMYVAPELDAAIDDLEARTGVRAAHGGEHAGMGTHNALLGLGERCYLEILAPSSPASAARKPGGLLAELTDARTFMWAVSTPDIEAAVAHAKQRGYDPGRVVDLSRKLPSGETLKWKLSIGGADVAGSVVPFLIQWENDPHPAETSPAGCRYRELRAEHPEPERIAAALAALQVALPVKSGSDARLVLSLDTPEGPLDLQ